MASFPYYGFPFGYSYYNYPNHRSNYKKNSIIDENFKINNTIKPSTSYESYEEDKPLFEILGFKLYLDDIIIMGVLFFLYQEKVNDEMLYIILFLLLLS